jgi:ankyrin repeat protein
MSEVDLIIQESTVLLFLLNDNYDIKQINKDGQTCLHHACIDGYIDVVNLLISKGIDIFINDNKDKTALEYAFENNHIDIAKKLLDIGLKTNMDKIIELFVSCFPEGSNIHKGIDEEDETYSNTDLGIFLIDNGLSSDSVIDGSENGGTIFGHICLTGYKRILNHMINKGATINIDFINSEYRSCPLIEACYGNFSEIVSILLENGANLYRNETECQTPLEYAFENNHIDVAKKLLDIGLKTNMDKIVELFISCFPKGPNIYKGIDEEEESYSNTDLGIFLIDYGLSPDSLIDVSKYSDSDLDPRMDGCTIFGHICFTGYKRILNHMINKGATINIDFINSEDTDCPLTEACCGNFSEIVSILLENGADPYRNITGCQTPLMIACTGCDDRGPWLYPNTKIIKMLVEAGANVNAKSRPGHSGLFWLINGFERIFDDNIYDAIDFLLKNGADVNEMSNEDIDNQTLLMEHPNDYRFISILIKYSPNLDIINDEGASILHLTKNEDVVKLLIENGANCNIKNSEGDTILHDYASFLNIEMCEYIISFGGNSLEKNDDNETVFDVIGGRYENIEPFIGPIEKDSVIPRKCKLTDEQKNDCIEILKRARERYLDKVRRDENWERRKDFMMVLIKHGFKDESYDVVKDTSVKIPGVKRDKEYLVKKIFTVPKRTVNESIKNGESCENIMSFL